jgi:hypothetical protein
MFTGQKPVSAAIGSIGMKRSANGKLNEMRGPTTVPGVQPGGFISHSTRDGDQESVLLDVLFSTMPIVFLSSVSSTGSVRNASRLPIVENKCGM